MTIAVKPIADRVIRANEPITLNLLNDFDDSQTTGLVARFELYNSSLGGGVTNVVLFDQAGAGAPRTVQNFRKYVNDGDYTNSIIHRSVPGFVVQGGGFTVNGLSAVLAQTPGDRAAAVKTIPTDAPVVNEFSPGRSNVRGTIAMAKLGNDPNSATSQWFFNLADNAANLDNQNGGFTVFGQVISAQDLAPLDAIATLPRGDATDFFGQPAFTSLPLQLSSPTLAAVTGDENFARYRSISVSQVNELRFEVIRNSNPNGVTATIANNQLVLNASPGAARTAEITVRATNLLGQTAEDTFVVKLADRAASRGNDILLGTNGRNTLRGLRGNDEITGLAGNDRLFGDQGADKLLGDAGNDRLEGGAGNDRITTGEGRDTIVIGRRAGFDRVMDFSDRLDKIDLVDGLSFRQVRIRQQGDDTLVRVGGTRLLLEGISTQSLSAADFR